MKRAIYIAFCAIFLFSSCQSEPEKAAVITSEKTTAATEGKTEVSKKTLIIPWTVELNESTQLMEIRKNPGANMANLDAKDIVEILNKKYPEIKLEWVKQEEHKAFVKISDAAYLTSQSGSQGARAYLAEATFSLTELKGITAVDFSFTEGDHAAPGVYTRETFKNFN